jgi:acetyl-CoA C-acetyltransferase
VNDTIEPSLSPAPTIVGVATAVGRPGDHEAPDAVGWMERALVGALDDAAGPGGSARVELAAEVGWVGVAEGTWRCSDAGAVLAERLGLGAGGPVHTVRADIGILQQRLIAEACGAILRGEVQAAVVVGAAACRPRPPVPRAPNRTR